MHQRRTALGADVLNLELGGGQPDLGVLDAAAVGVKMGRQ